MQKCSLLTFACCLMLLFTACKKETLLETNQDLNPKTNLTTNNPTTVFSKGTNSLSISEAVEAELDEADSLSIFSLLITQYKKSQQDAATACFGPITGICGSPVVYSSCYYKYQIWNDPTNLYVDLYFPSSVVGSQRDCNGRTCQYYVTPAISLDLYDVNGNKIGAVTVANSDITVTETRITFNINTLKGRYPSLACVKLSGVFYIMKKCTSSYQCGGYVSQCGGHVTQCNTSAPQRVSTVCITPQQFCLQQCPSECPTVGDISLDKSKLCGSGSVRGTVTVNGDASKTSTTWSVDGQSLSGNSASFDFAQNTTCLIVTKTIHVKVVCTTDQSVLAEKDLTVTLNPSLSASVSVDNYACAATIDLACQSDATTVSWNLGSVQGTGTFVQLDSSPQTLNYTVSSNGCNVSGTADNLYCLPLFKSNQINTK